MTRLSSQRHAILIAGMHRSGTSALARVLNLRGAELGDALLPPREDNPLGYWESADVIALNDACLEHFGTTWHDPKPMPEGWTGTRWARDCKARLLDLLAQRHATSPLIAIKDPRISRLLPLWLDVLDEAGFTPHVIITLRHPDEVATSLEKRRDERLDPIRARLLWLTYLLEAERDSRGVSRAFVSYDELLSDWRRLDAALADQFDITWPNADQESTAAIDGFLNPDQRRQRSTRLVDERSSRLAKRCTELYQRLTAALPDIDSVPFHEASERLRDDIDLLKTQGIEGNASQQTMQASRTIEQLLAPSELIALHARVYFPHEDGHYDEVRSLEVALPAARGHRCARFICPEGSKLSRVRFDPAETPGTYRIHHLEINGSRVQASRFHILAIGGTRLTSDDDSVRFHADNNDPWIEFDLGDFRAYGIESENSTAPGQMFDDSPIDSGSIGQESADIWTAQADLQPVLHKSDRLPSRGMPLSGELHTLAVVFERESLSDLLTGGLHTLALGQHALAEQQQRQTECLEVWQAQVETVRAELAASQQHILGLTQQIHAGETTHAAILERVRENSHAALLAAHATAPDADSPPRGGIRLQAKPHGHLRVLARRQGSDLRAWACAGAEGYFELVWPGTDPLPAGWYVLRASLQSPQGELAAARLRIQVADSSANPRLLTLALSPGSLRQRLLLRFDEPVHALALEPCPDQAHGEFLLGNSLSLRRVGSIEAMLRLGVSAIGNYRTQGATWTGVLREIRTSLKQGGTRALDNLHANAQAKSPAALDDYATWIAAWDTLDDAARRRIDDDIAAMASAPLISIVMPVYNTPERWLHRCIDSVLEQRYPHWQLCIADDASTEAHVRRVLDSYAKRDDRIQVVHREVNGHISAASNSAIAIAKGEWIALLDHDDELPEHALYHVARAILDHPDAMLIYSDEDKITEDGRRFDPYFKPDWNPQLFLGHNMFSHFGVYRHALVQQVGGFREGWEGSQDYDLALRCIEQVQRRQILHIPKVLYHWRAISGSTALAPDAKNYAHVAANKAIQAHLDRIGVDAEVLPIEHRAGNWRIRRRLPLPAPKVSIIIPTRNGGKVLRRCLESIEARTDYPDFDLLVINNQSDHEETLALLDELRQHPRHRVLDFDEPFNFSRLNNFAAARADGPILLFLNDDTEVINGNWLRELVSLAVAPDAGAVGAMLYYPDDHIQHAGIVLGLGADRIAGHAYHRLPRGFPGDKCRAHLVQEMSAVTAACLAIRRDRFEAVGGFDESLGVAFNDVDLCLRLAQHGWHNLWTPNAELYHHESMTRGSDLDGPRHDAYLRECAIMRERWGDLLLADPSYHPALSLDKGDFMTYTAPRTHAQMH